jgi:hypothetical protein
MYLKPTTVYGSLIPGSEYIRSLADQGKLSPNTVYALICERFIYSPP